MSELPEAIDGYRVEALLGRGGMGAVFQVREELTSRPIALKLIERDGDDASHARLVHEARALAQISHPNVVSLYRLGRQPDGRPYLAYEYVPGTDFDTLLGSVPWRRAVSLGVELCRGLRALHRAGIVHRDVKPSNVVLDDAGRVKVIDLGLAQGVDVTEELVRPSRPPDGVGPLTLTLAGKVVGTPRYLPPERWRGEPATASSDVYAAALVLMELVSGPVSIAPGEEAPPPGDDLPEDLAEILLAASGPDRRLPTIEPLLERLEEIDEAHRIVEDLAGDGLIGPLAGDPERVEVLVDRVFASETSHLLPDHRTGQRRKLASTLHAAVRGPDADWLAAVKAIHRAYGVPRDQVDRLHEDLLRALAEAGVDDAPRAALAERLERLAEAVT